MRLSIQKSRVQTPVWRLVLCLFVMALYASQASASWWQSDFPELNLPSAMKIEVVADAMRMNGLNTQILRFEMSEGEQALITHFQDQWGADFAQKQADRWNVLSRRDGDWLITIQYPRRDSALSATSGSSPVAGLITISDFFAALESNRPAPQVDIPMTSDSRLVQHLEANDFGRPSQTLIFVNQDSAHQNLDYYRSYFREQGYVPTLRGGLVRSTNGGVMLLNRGAEQVNLTAVERNGETWITVVKSQQ